MTARLLPFAEWSRLRGTELDHLATMAADPGGVVVVVVEQDAQIVACWAAVQTVHVEGLWQAEAFRTHAGVGRLLLGRMLGFLREHAITEVLTSATSSDVEAMLTKLGGSPIPGRLWHFPIPPERE
jgi:hypothetical protein